MSAMNALTMLFCVSALAQGARLLASAATREADKHIAAVAVVLCGLCLTHYGLMLLAPAGASGALRWLPSWLPLVASLTAVVACWRATRRRYPHA